MLFIITSNATINITMTLSVIKSFTRTDLNLVFFTLNHIPPFCTNLLGKELNFDKENEFQRQGRIRGVCNRVWNDIWRSQNCNYFSKIYYFLTSNLYPIPLIVSIYLPFFPSLCLIFFIWLSIVLESP